MEDKWKLQLCKCALFSSKVVYRLLGDIREHLGLNSACGFSFLAPQRYKVIADMKQYRE